jgi:hypothetical protein
MTPDYLAGAGEQILEEPPSVQVGDRVRLRQGAIATHPEMTVAQVDAQAQKVQIRFSRPPGTQGYSYLFWRDAADVIGPERGAEDGATFVGILEQRR